VIKLI